MATTPIWYTATRTLLAAMRAADRQLHVSAGWPGDKNDRKRMLWVFEVRPAEERPVITGGRLHRDDFFTIELRYRVSGMRTGDDALDALQTLDALVDDYLAAEHTLDDLDGIVSAEVGVGAFTVDATPGGVVGFGRREINLHARLT